MSALSEPIYKNFWNEDFSVTISDSKQFNVHWLKTEKLTAQVVLIITVVLLGIITKCHGKTFSAFSGIS